MIIFFFGGRDCISCGYLHSHQDSIQFPIYIFDTLQCCVHEKSTEAKDENNNKKMCINFVVAFWIALEHKWNIGFLYSDLMMLSTARVIQQTNTVFTLNTKINILRGSFRCLFNSLLFASLLLCSASLFFFLGSLFILVDRFLVEINVRPFTFVCVCVCSHRSAFSAVAAVHYCYCYAKWG